MEIPNRPILGLVIVSVSGWPSDKDCVIYRWKIVTIDGLNASYRQDVKPCHLVISTAVVETNRPVLLVAESPLALLIGALSMFAV